MKKEKVGAPTQEELPSPIQLTPDQLAEVTGGVVVAPACVIRIGIPPVTIAALAAVGAQQV